MMEILFKWNVFYLCLLFVHLCNGKAIGPNDRETDSHAKILTGVISLLLTVCFLIFLAACLCCQRRKRFEQFRNNPITASSISDLDHGHVNPIANGEFTIFSPLSPHYNNNVFHTYDTKPKTVEDTLANNYDISCWFNPNEKDFPRTKLKYIKELGTGWFGKVVEGAVQDVDNRGQSWSPVVVRILEATSSQKEKVLFLQNSVIYKIGHHENILSLVGKSVETIPYLLLQEYCPRGDLKTYLRSRKDDAEQFLSTDYPLLWCHQLVSALEFIHEKGIVHPDLATRNCHLTTNLILKVGDYGLGPFKYPADYYQGQPTVPVRWCAPESLNFTQTTIQPKKITPEANVWSLAVTMWEICECGEQPYWQLTDDEVISEVLGGPNLRLERPSYSGLYTDYIFRLMHLCWTSPESRPKVLQIHIMLTDLLQVHNNTSTTDVLNVDEFDRRWDLCRPNTIIKTDLVSDVLLASEERNSARKALSLSLTNLHGSLDNLNFSDHRRNPDDVSKTDHTSNEYDSCQRISSGSETEEENWRNKVEQGAYTEKVRQKSRSVADLMVLTHVDYSESESETPLQSLEYNKVNYKNVRLAGLDGVNNLENSTLTFGSEGNLLNVQDTFEQELKKLREECRDSLLFVPDNNSQTSIRNTDATASNVTTSRLMQELNSPVDIQPVNQIFNIYNVTIDNFNPVRLNNRLSEILDVTSQIKPNLNDFEQLNVINSKLNQKIKDFEDNEDVNVASRLSGDVTVEESIEDQSNVLNQKISRDIVQEFIENERRMKLDDNISLLEQIRPSEIKFNTKEMKPDVNSYLIKDLNVPDTKFEETSQTTEKLSDNLDFNCKLNPMLEIDLPNKVHLTQNSFPKTNASCQELISNLYVNKHFAEEEYGKLPPVTEMADFNSDLNGKYSTKLISTDIEETGDGRIENRHLPETNDTYMKIDSTDRQSQLEVSLESNDLKEVDKECKIFDTTHDKWRHIDCNNTLKTYERSETCDNLETGWTNSTFDVVRANDSSIKEDDVECQTLDLNVQLPVLNTTVLNLHENKNDETLELFNYKKDNVCIENEKRRLTESSEIILPYTTDNESLEESIVIIIDEIIARSLKQATQNSCKALDTNLSWDLETDPYLESDKDSVQMFSTNKQLIDTVGDINTEPPVSSLDNIEQTVNFDLSLDQEEVMPNSLTHSSLFTSSTPYSKRSLENKYSNRKMEDNIKNYVPDTRVLNYSLETWDNFLGLTFDNQNQHPENLFDSFSSEPKSLFFVGDLMDVLDDNKQAGIPDADIKSSAALKNTYNCDDNIRSDEKCAHTANVESVSNKNEVPTEAQNNLFTSDAFDNFSSEPQSLIFIESEGIYKKCDEIDEVKTSGTKSICDRDHSYNVDKDAEPGSSQYILKNDRHDNSDYASMEDINSSVESILNNTYTIETSILDTTYTKEKPDALNTPIQGDLGPKEGTFENGGGWFLHPQPTTELCGDIQVEPPNAGSYVGFGIDDEVMSAIRNELLSKLPHAQGNNTEKVQENDELDLFERNEVFLRYNVYNTCLSPIPEESFIDDVSSTNSPKYERDYDESEWSSGRADTDTLTHDIETTSAHTLESPLCGPLNRHTPSQDSCCSNDTLFNLEDLNCGVIDFEKDTDVLSIPNVEDMQTGKSSESNEDNKLLLPVECSATKDSLSLSTKPRDAITSFLSSERNYSVVVPLPSPEENPWKHLPASVLNHNQLILSNPLTVEDESNLQEGTYCDNLPNTKICDIENTEFHITECADLEDEESEKLKVTLVKNPLNSPQLLSTETDLASDDLRDGSIVNVDVVDENKHSVDKEVLEEDKEVLEETNNREISEVQSDSITVLAEDNDEPRKDDHLYENTNTKSTEQLYENTNIREDEHLYENTNNIKDNEQLYENTNNTKDDERLYENVNTVIDSFDDYVNIVNRENTRNRLETQVTDKEHTYINTYEELDKDEDDSIYGILTDIRFTGPADSQMMSTSFSENNDEQGWESGSDSRSSSSGEFIWREGEHEESLKALRAAPQDLLESVTPMEDIVEDNYEESDLSSNFSDDEESPEFVPSAWDKFAMPSKSALRSPEKTLKKREEKKPKGVWFKKQKYHCIYEYPKEPESPILPNPELWKQADFKVFSDNPCSTNLAEELFITSSSRPFQTHLSSQFFPGSSSWNFDSATPDSGMEDITPGSITDSTEFENLISSVPTLKQLASEVLNKQKTLKIINSDVLGGLRHTKKLLKLDLPPSPSAFSSDKMFIIEPTVESVVREKPTFTTFGKSRFSVQHVDTPPDVCEGKNVSFEALPYKPLSPTLDNISTNLILDYVEAPSVDIRDFSFVKPVIIERSLIKNENDERKSKVEAVRGESSLLDSGDEDSGIESTSTLERKTSNAEV